MSTDALKLANALEEKDYPPRRAAANELRRLHEENERLKAASTAQRQWVGLTDDEIKEIIGSWGDTPIRGYTRKLFDEIEAKLKEKIT